MANTAVFSQKVSLFNKWPVGAFQRNKAFASLIKKGDTYTKPKNKTEYTLSEGKNVTKSLSERKNLLHPRRRFNLRPTNCSHQTKTKTNLCNFTTDQSIVNFFEQQLYKKHFQLVESKTISEGNTFIIDFYNVYCSFVRFNKNGIFTSESIKLCFDKIISYFGKNDEIIIISKILFEFPEEEIIKFSRMYSNVTFVSVFDNHSIPSKNRERDDFMCLLIQFTFNTHNRSNCIVTNDKFSNYTGILSDIKPFSIRIISQGEIESKVIFTHEKIEAKVSVMNTETYNKSKINRIGFMFKNTSY